MNILVHENGIVNTFEYPTIPIKIYDTDIVIENVDNQELINAILDSSVDVKITNFETLEFITITKDLPIINEEVDEEKAFLAEAVIQLSNEIEILKQEINRLKGGN